MRFSASNKIMITEKSFEGCVTNAHHLPLGRSFSLAILNSRELDMVLKTPMYCTTDNEEEDSSSQGSHDGNSSSGRVNACAAGIPTMIEIGSVNGNNYNDNEQEEEDFKDKIRSQIMLRKRKASKKNA